MIKRISNRLSIISSIIMVLGVLLQMMYVLIGSDDSNLWWAFDKASDRLFMVGLLWIVFFSYIDKFLRMMACVTSLFIILQLTLEILYIYQICTNVILWHALLIIAVIAYSITLITSFYERQRRI